ncbi:hypothetical protein AALP_AA6G028300 [Arabis alpina]|uniref:Remorin C-terminal domain-containing protein n=1 Tax=Arabis alpina TaxID=50452 RepID=A0A087GLQ4_ARAAL|nr:hypothetical protein AALP_AA6G028300 [Arabis alpina]
MVEDQKISLDTESPAPAPAPAKVEDKSHNPPPIQNLDVNQADLSKEKSLSFFKAWEDSEKSKAENKAEKTISDILAWENNKKTAVESQLKKIEEKIEKKKAKYAEKMKNKVAEIHKKAEERRAKIAAKRGEEILKTRIMGAKCRHTGFVPDATCGCFQGFSVAKCAKRSLYSMKWFSLLS